MAQGMGKYWRAPRAGLPAMAVALNAVAVTVACLLFLSRAHLPAPVAEALDRLRGWEHRQILALVAAGALLCLNLLVGLRRLLGAETLDHLTVPREDGAIRIGIPALEEALLRAALEHAGVQDARMHVFVSRRPGRPVRVLASVIVADRPDLPEVQESLRQAVRRRIGELIPLDAPVHVYVKVRRIVPEGEPRRPGPRAGAAPFPAFGAPQYPVEKE